MTDYEVVNDGDANYHVPYEEVVPPIVKQGGVLVTMTLLEVVNAPAGFDLGIQEEPTEVKVEMMPRDFGRLSSTIANGDVVTVSGLFVGDVGHEDDRENILEIHPAFMVQEDGELPTFSGKKHAGSPYLMHPKSGKVDAPANDATFKDKRRHIPNDWRYCWYEDGNPCLDWNGNPTFG